MKRITHSTFTFLLGAFCLLTVCAQDAPKPAPAEKPPVPLPLRFEKKRITPQYWAEGASVADLNRDGHLDIVCGGHWYVGPTFAERHEYTTPVPANKRGPYDMYVYTLEHFFSWTHDFNADGWTDILVVGLTGRAAAWFENPGRFPDAAKQEVIHWKRHELLPGVFLETVVFDDLLGEGRPQFVCAHNKQLGYARPDPAGATQPWKFTPLSPELDLMSYVNAHSLGIGDVDGDGRKDVLRKDGWWRQPAQAGALWTFHPFKFAHLGGAEMYAYDVNGDGLNDIITSLHAHAWGLSWFEQTRDAQGAISFKEHVILAKEERGAGNRFGVQFSQLHALALTDMDGDGVLDLVTGKTYLAHDGGDPGLDQPAVLYWFKLTRDKGQAEFVPHLIDDDSGIGRRIITTDLNKDGLLDIVIGNKKGLFVFKQTGDKVATGSPVRAAAVEVVRAKVRLRVAGAQIPVTRDVRANVAAITRAIEFARREQADVLVTPEGSLSGYWPGFDAEATRQALEEVVRKTRVAKVALVLGTCFAEADGRRYDGQRFYNRDGEFLGFHSKILLCRRVADPAAKGEIDFFQSSPLRTFTLQGLRVGGLVCNDMWANPEWTPMPDPYLARQLAGLGARVIFLSVNAGQDEGEALALNRSFHESNLRLRARGAGLWAVAADAADPEGKKSSNCPSGVLGPDGRWAVQVEPKGEQFFAHTIELEQPH